MATATILDLYRHELNRPRDNHYCHVSLTGKRYISTEEFLTGVIALADGLVKKGVRRSERVIILSDNRPEWHQIDLAVLSLGAIDVPVYPTLAPAAVAYHINDSGANVVITENPNQTRKVLAKQSECPGLETIIQIEGDCDEGVIDYEELVSAHSDNCDRERFWRHADLIKADDLASIVYTSGTTGNPKGVMLTHGNFVSNVEAVLPRVPIDGSDHGLEFLPLCHVFERVCGYAYMRLGISRTYCAPGVVADHIADIAPTAFASVPRLFEKIHAKIMTRVQSSSGMRRGLFNWAINIGHQVTELHLAGLKPSGSLGFKYAIANKLVFGKIRAAFGGRVKLALSGGAPLSPDLNRFFHAIGIPIQEGYGLTETSPGIGISGYKPNENRLGAVGKPLDNLEIKLAEDGELLVRGPSITQGYWQRPEETAEAFDKEGFFRTGDIAKIDDDGFLFITDRKKDILIPTGGKNVAPQPIENELKASIFIDNAVMIGDAKPYIVALISPSEDDIIAWASNKGLGGISLQDLLNEDKVQDVIEKAVNDINAQLGHFEQIKKFRILPKPLTLEDDFLTPTLKVKRKKVAEAYSSLISEMYQ